MDQLLRNEKRMEDLEEENLALKKHNDKLETIIDESNR